MLRDRSTLTLGIFLPMLLLLLFGFGLSLDVDLVPVTVVRDTSSPATRDLYTSLKLSPYFQPVMADSMAEAEAALNGAGRLLVRPSGTEKLIRVMAEGDDEALVKRVVADVAGAVRSA